MHRAGTSVLRARVVATIAAAVLVACTDETTHTTDATRADAGAPIDRDAAPGTDAGPPPVPDPDQCDGVELPRETVDTTWVAPTGRTIRVEAGGDLQAALDAAQRGDEVVLAAGATFVGTFTLGPKDGEGWIVVRSDVELPPRGTRVTPELAAGFARIVSTGATPAIRTEPFASHWRLVALDVTYADDVRTAYSLVTLGSGGADQDQLDEVPHHLILDRSWIHGHAEVAFQRCVALNSAHTAVIDSSLTDCHHRGFDSQAICGWNGPGPFLIENNLLEGAAENIMLGGADAQSPELVPHDVTIRHNHIRKPPEWAGVWSVKNLFEIKSAVRVLFEENVLENNWTDAQTGVAILLKGDAGANARTLDLTVRRNWIVRSPGALSMSPAPGDTPPESAMDRVCIVNNLFEEMGRGSGFEGAFRAAQLLGPLTHVRVERNTMLGGWDNQVILEGAGKVALAFERNVVDTAGYGVGQLGELDELGVDISIEGNVMATATWNAMLPESNCVTDTVLPVPEECSGAGADAERIRAIGAEVAPGS